LVPQPGSGTADGIRAAQAHWRGAVSGNCSIREVEKIMNNMILHLVIWAVLATVVVFLALYRRRLNLKTDELLHVLDAEAPMIASQTAIGKRLEKVDFWGKSLTVIVALYAVAIGGLYLYKLFTDTSIRMN
jgi:hypothetical protein